MLSSLRCSRKPSADSNAPERPPKKRPRWQRVLIIISIVLFVLAFLAFLAIWVALPIAFKYSISFQRSLLFINIDDPKNPEFNNPQKYGVEGVLNFYFTTQDLDGVTLVDIGSWIIVHEDEIELYKNSTRLNASEIISNTEKPVLIYMHGVACNRVKPIAPYKVIRKNFLIVAPDHRGYGDSGTNVDLSEVGVVSDTVQLYKWVRSKTNNAIYIWGHSLGAALSAHAVRALKEQEDVVPMGLILESPFTTMRDEIVALAKLFRWLAYFNQTILDPPEKNGFLFRSTTNILSADCPIMIMHAEDDNVIPYTLGRRLYEVAVTQRDLETQGNVTYHQFPAVGYKHIGITNDPKVSQYIADFVEECVAADKGRG